MTTRHHDPYQFGSPYWLPRPHQYPESYLHPHRRHIDVGWRGSDPWDRDWDGPRSYEGSREDPRDWHARSEPDFRGRGPKGYRRTDERIREDVNDHLTEDPYVDASDIEVAVSSGEVTLSGTVPDRRSRRRAEDLVEAIPGVSFVQNNLRLDATKVSEAGTPHTPPIPRLGRGMAGTKPTPSVASQIGGAL